MHESPLVSILLLSMNHEPYVAQCIQSIKEQTYNNIEIIYLDNASADNTYEVCKSLLRDSGIPFHLFKNESSKSISHNFNFLLDHASGEFICPFSTDDWMHPDNIEKKVTFYLAHPGTGALFSNGWFYFEDTAKLELNDSSTFRRGRISKEILQNPDCIFYVGMMYSKKIFEEVGNWDEDMIIEDVDMFVRIAQVADIDYLSEPLVYYRRSSRSVSKNKKFMIRGSVLYYNKYKELPWINMRQWLAERYRSYAADSVDQHKHKEAFGLLLHAIKLVPFGKKNFQTLFYLIRSFLKSGH